ncbi:carbohydrate ABC transporter permease [Lachnoclostridium phytofermentans]|uniref:carbohydrate ABC transporter permease n=1 Tax=Lachnoclostridium phytofermentans TaxID=66219 RepID=UPI000496663A|nr:carbohydrate ABC transporter permease [Lachnoclostridium phytofermentans]
MKKHNIISIENKRPRVNKDKLRKLLLGTKEKKGLLNQLFLYSLLICIGFVYLYPLLYMISKSFMSLEDLLDTSISWIPSKLNFGNYLKAARSMDYLKTFLQSVIVAGIPTLLNVIVCSFVGYGFARFEFKGKKLMLGILIFSFILPPQITMMPTYVLFNNLKLVGKLQSFLIPALLGQGLNAQIFILIFYQFFKLVPKVLIEAAHIDGAGFFRSFLRISVPSAKPAYITVFLFSLVWYWNESYLTQLYVSGVYIKGTLSTLIIKLKQFDVNYNTMQTVEGVATSNNESIRMAATLLSILPVLIMYFIMQRSFVESIDRTGITGE